MTNKLDKEYFDQPVERLVPKECMSLSDDSSLSDVLKVMQEHKFGSMLLTKDGSISSIVTEKDILFKVGNTYSNVKDHMAKEFATKKPFSLSNHDSIITCMTLMTSLAIRHVPIIHNGKNFMLSINNVLEFLISHFEDTLMKYGIVQNPDEEGIYYNSENILDDISSESESIDENLFGTSLDRMITNKFLKVDVSYDLYELIDLMKENLCTVVVVVEYETSIRGIITERDILLKVFGKFDLKPGQLKVIDVMTHKPHCLYEKHCVAHVINNMSTFRYRNIVLMDRDKYPLAIIGLSDVLNFLVRCLNLDSSIDILQNLKEKS